MKKDIFLIVFQAAAVLILAALLIGCIDICCAADLYNVYAVFMAVGCLAFIVATALMMITNK